MGDKPITQNILYMWTRGDKPVLNNAMTFQGERGGNRKTADILQV